MSSDGTRVKVPHASLPGSAPDATAADAAADGSTVTMDLDPATDAFWAQAAGLAFGDAVELQGERAAPSRRQRNPHPPHRSSRSVVPPAPSFLPPRRSSRPVVPPAPSFLPPRRASSPHTTASLQALRCCIPAPPAQQRSCRTSRQRRQPSAPTQAPPAGPSVTQCNASPPSCSRRRAWRRTPSEPATGPLRPPSRSAHS